MYAVYAIVMRHHEVARAQFKYDVARWSVTSALLIILICVNVTGHGSGTIQFLFFGLVILQELAVWMISRTLCRYLWIRPLGFSLILRYVSEKNLRFQLAWTLFKIDGECG